MSIDQERPIADPSDDLFDRVAFIKRLSQGLLSPDEQRSNGVVVGISGEWGSGKSSVLNLLARHLRDEKGAIVVQFDPWLISGRDDLVRRLLLQLASKLSEPSFKEKARKAGESLFEYVEALSPLTDAALTVADMAVPGAGTITKIFASKAKAKLTRAADLHSMRDRLKESLGEVEQPIIVLIDELDRLEDDEIRAMAQLVRSVADFPQISYVLAYDAKRVAAALGRDAGSSEEARLRFGAAYLEKIVQHQIPMPVPDREGLFQLADSVIGTIAQQRGFGTAWHQQPDCQHLLKILIPHVLRTPRDIKRWTGLFKIQESMFYGEVDWVDILALSALMVKAPATVENIKNEPEWAKVEIPSNLELESRREISYRDTTKSENNRENTLSKLVQENEKSAYIYDLIEFMFKNIPGNRSNRRNNNPDRLCETRPFLTMLRYGLPIGHFSRDKIDQFLSATREDRKLMINQAIDGGNGSAFLQRFSEIYEQGTGTNHPALWGDIAEIQRKPDDAWQRESSDHDISHDFARVLTRRACQDISFPSTPVIAELRRLKDLEILPCVIHGHLFGHGLFGMTQEYEESNWIDKSFAEGLAHEIGKEFSDNFMTSSTAFAKTWDLYPYYIAKRAGYWSEECRTKATNDLKDIGFLDTMVIMMFGKNVMTDKEEVENMFDFNKFMDAIDMRIKGQDFSDRHISLRASYDKVIDRFGSR